MQTTHPIETDLNPRCPQWIYRFGRVEGPAAWRTTIAPALVDVLNAPSTRSRQTLLRFAEQAVRRGAEQLEELDPHHAALLIGAAEDTVGCALDLSPEELVAISDAAWA